MYRICEKEVEEKYERKKNKEKKLRANQATTTKKIKRKNIETLTA